MPRKPPAKPPADPNASDDAVRWFRDRLLMTDEEFRAIEEATHDAAFTIAGVSQLDMVEEVWSRLDQAVANGETLQDFQEHVGERLASAWGGEQPWRVETIFRTNAAQAYAAGRYVQMTQPAVLKARPYWRFSGIGDQRQTVVCLESDGTILPADHPWWNGHYPPNHFQCRSHVVTLSEAEAEEEGITPDPTTTPAMEGFGSAPSAPGAEDVEPDLTQYPQDLAKAYAEG